ncbi:MAG: DNA/RNA nuclease SfsA [Caldisericia bacterium]|nr:DNA/RNA nuclease SfsA [Caldisericia bacterium]
MENFSKANRLIYLPFDGKGYFIERKNKFLGLIEFNKKIFEAHIHDPGRLEKILFKGNEILFQKNFNPKRKTKYEIIFGKYLDEFILINSKYHNSIAEKLISLGYINEIKKLKLIKKEVRINESKIDFLVINEEGKEYFIEVKGCTLENEKVALFPDAPTKRGSRHLKELCNLLEKHKNSILIFLIFTKQAEYFSPNKEIDKNFYENFINCIKRGLSVYSFRIEYNINDKHLYLSQIIPLKII